MIFYTYILSNQTLSIYTTLVVELGKSQLLYHNQTTGYNGYLTKCKTRKTSNDIIAGNGRYWFSIIMKIWYIKGAFSQLVIVYFIIK